MIEYITLVAINPTTGSRVVIGSHKMRHEPVLWHSLGYDIEIAKWRGRQLLDMKVLFATKRNTA